MSPATSHTAPGAAFSRSIHRTSTPRWGVVATSSQFVVDPSSKSCSDNAVGTVGSPLCTVAAGVSKCRGSGGPSCTVALRGGQTHRLNATISLTPSDSGLTIMGYPGDAPPVVSGAALLSPQWTQVPPAPTAPQSVVHTRPVVANAPIAPSRCTLYDHTDCTGGFDLDTPNVATAEACMAACEADCRCAVGVWGQHGTSHTCYLKQVTRSLDMIVHDSGHI